jgi:hypothetical protein
LAVCRERSGTAPVMALEDELPGLFHELAEAHDTT